MLLDGDNVGLSGSSDARTQIYPEPCLLEEASDKRFEIVPLVIVAELLSVNDGKLR